MKKTFQGTIHLLSLCLALCWTTSAIGASASLSLTVTLESVAGACNGANGAITVSASGGTAPYAFTWSNGASGPAIFNLAPGAYTVTVSDALNATASLTVDVPVVDSLDISLVLTKASCPGVNDGTATVVVNPPGGSYSYSWNIPGSPNLPQITGLAAGTTVCVTVTDQVSGCVGIACGTIASHNQVKLVVTATDASCDGQLTGSATAIASQGTAPYQFVWNVPGGTNTATTSTLTGLGPGVYTVTATDQLGCIGLGAAVIGTVNAPQADFNFSLVECRSDSGTVSFQLNNLSSVSPPAAITSWSWLVTWSTGFATFDVENPPLIVLPAPDTGIIQLIVTTSDNCSDTTAAPFALPAPPVISLSVSPSEMACPGDSVTITLTGDPSYTYVWSTPNDLVFDPFPFLATTTGTQTATYTVTASQDICTTTASVTITRPPVIEIDIQGDSLFTCLDSVTLQLVNPAAFTNVMWTTCDGTPLDPQAPLVLPAGATLCVVVSGQDTLLGCPSSDTAYYTSGTVEVSLTLPPPGSLCESDTLTLTAIPDNLTTYQWIVSDPSLIISGNGTPVLVLSGPAGDYTVTLIAASVEGCADTVQVPIQISAVPDSIATAHDLCPGETVALNPGFNPDYTYQWTADPADPNLDPTAGNPVVAPATPTNYAVTITNGNCSLEQNVLVTPHPADMLEAAPDTTLCAPDSVSLYVVSPTGSTYQWSNTSTFDPVLHTGPVYDVIPGSGTSWYYVRSTNSFNCVSVDSVLVRNEQLDITYNPVRVLCGPGSVQLEIINLDPTDTLSYQWTPELPAVSNPMVSPTASTLYTVVVTNQAGCTETGAIQVYYADLEVGVTLDGPALINPGDTVRLVAQATGGTGYSWLWYPLDHMIDPIDSSSVLVHPEETSDYTVVVTDTLTGCTAQATVRVTVAPLVCGPPYIFIPTAFTPNGDGNNDFFRVRSVNVTELYFIVFNRWGEKMYQTEEVDHEGWDGRARGQIVPPDAYAWYLRAVCGNEEVYEAKGNVTLLK